MLFRFSAVVFVLALCTSPARSAEFSSDFANTHDRVWIGKDYWANPMEDWRVHNGRLECTVASRNRNVHLLTRQLSKKAGTLKMSVRCGLLKTHKAGGSVGFRIGIHDKEAPDYRAWLIYGQGLNVGVTTAGSIFIGKDVKKNAIPPAKLTDLELVLQLTPAQKQDVYIIQFTVLDAAENKLADMRSTFAQGQNLYGNIALVNNHLGKSGAAYKGKKGKKKKKGQGPGPQFWLKNWRVSGSKVVANDERAFGPICWSMHTLSRGVMTMTAQMPPVSERDAQIVQLEIREDNQWKSIARARIAPLSYTATFRVSNWADDKDVPYRLAYEMRTKDGKSQDVFWTGTVRKDPVDKKSIVVAGFTGNADYGFPNLQLVKNVRHHNPDVLFFSGDQIYEYVGGYGIYRALSTREEPADSVLRACLNYLRKWFLVGLAFGEVMRDRPSICIPDDHDVYQGNIWGNGGNPITLKKHASGGYVMHPDFVNAVHRTQCSNLPSAFDPRPIKQDISTYYCDMVYGRVGFAVIADRMFKSGPEGTVATWKGRPDHIRDPKIDVKMLDKPGLKYLGDRQLKFLRKWAADWRGADMKCVLSQTLFTNLANYHGRNRMFLVGDLDSGGWPQTGRNKALREIRKGFAFHLCGDQHLASLVHYGIDQPGDAGFALCVPSIANFYPRRWIPDEEGKKPLKKRPKSALPNTGDYIEGLGNPIRVHAIGNPKEKYRKGRIDSLHDKASGYGIVRFHRDKQTITIECWKLLVDVSKPKKGDQFPGWPMTVRMTDNYGRKPTGYLPTVKVKGMTNPVVQVIEEKSKEIVYTLRIKGTEFRPMVFAPGRYTVKVGELGTKRVRVFKGVQPTQKDRSALSVNFE